MPASFFRSIDDPAIIAHIRNGAVGVLPTDTVYGLVASATNPAAVKRLYALKHRERKPGTTIAATVQQLANLGLPSADLAQATPLWPAAISVIFTLGHQFEYLHQGVGSAPFRVVSDPKMRELLEMTGPLLTSSANLPGEPEPPTIQEAQAYFDDQVDFYVDGGNLAGRPASTIVRFGDSGIEVLRQGVAVSLLGLK